MIYTRLNKIADISRANNNRIYPKYTSYIELSGTKGYIGLIKNEGNISGRNAVIIPKIKINPIYFNIVLQNALPRFISQYLTTINLQIDAVGKMEIAYDEEEQENIAVIFNELSEVIALKKKELSTLDNIIKARFVEMFDKCSEEVLIGDVISICRGASPRPIQSFITDDPDGVNWIKIGDVSENSLYITQTAERITKEGAKKSRVVHRGDFILSNSMSFGRPYILGIEGCVHDGWLILSDFRDTFDELYLYHTLRSEYVQHQFSEKVNGATVKNLNSDLVKETYIKVPEMNDQETFADFVKQVDKSKVVVKKALDEAQILFDSLMQEYFG